MSHLTDVCQEIITNLYCKLFSGEGGGSLKDPRYLFLLYVASRCHKEAAETPVIIANQEQLTRKYKPARDLLFSMY
uniref:Uncharacterized protein n=1 Tax=Glossina austeni TaxID=7395 RepID=A0A1A9UL76_GLOAU